MNEAEQLKAGPRRTADQVNVDDVDIHFDWLVPTNINEAITFALDIQRGTRTSSVRFQIDLSRLAEADLERLHAFLPLQHSGVRDDYTFTGSLTWLLDLSWQQSSTMSLPERQVAVRQTLLVP
jgi:hypothetical protein